MESSKGAPEPVTRTFSQVAFKDIPRSYPLSTAVTCCYTLTAAFQPSPRDWVGIFKVGWSSTKEYHTFVWVEPCRDADGPESATRQAFFKEYYLPKDEIDFYQFCYVDIAGQVRGASTPFCFQKSGEQSMESSRDDEPLVVTTQEQMEQSLREKAELHEELDQMREENRTLKNDLQTQQREAAGLKGQNERKEKVMSQLVEEMEQIKAQKEEMLTQMTKQMDIQQHDATEQRKQSLSLEGASRKNEEKYDRAVKKINQLKEEREALRGRLDAGGVETATLNTKLRDQERELFRLKDSIQLLQVDLQSSEKERERLCVEMQRLQRDMDGVKRENQDLRQQKTPPPPPPSYPDEELQMKCQTLASQLQDAEAKLEAERTEAKTTKRQAEFLDKELLLVRQQMEKVMMSYERAQREGGKLELQIADAHEVIANKDGVIEEMEHMMKLARQEKEELARENQNLISDMEALRRISDDPPHVQPVATSPSHDQQHTPENIDLPFLVEGAEDEGEEMQECRHCKERFPWITRKELEEHERSHKVCPYCLMGCDNMEQNTYEDHVYCCSFSHE